MAAHALDRRIKLGDGGLVNLIAVVLFALVVRVYASLQIAVLHDDGPTFIALAERISEGDWGTALSHPYHPLYPLMIAWLRNLTGDFESAAIACSILGGTIATLALYLFLRDAFDARVAWIGGLIFGMSPYLVRFTSDVASEGVYLACFLLGVAALYRALDRGGRFVAFGAGLLAGLAYLVRPEGMGLVVVGGALAGLRVYRRRWSLGDALRWALYLTAGFFLVAGPYLRIIQSIGDPVRLSGKKSLLYLAGLTEREPDGPGEFTSGLIAFLAAHSTAASCAMLALLGIGWLFVRLRRDPAVARRMQGEIRRLHVGWVLGLVSVALLGWLAGPAAREDFARVLISSLRPEIAILCAIGLATSRKAASGDRGLFIGVLVGTYLIVLLGLVSNYGYLSRRHAVPVMALLLGHAALGVVWSAERLSNLLARASAGRLRPTTPTALAFVIAALMLMALPKALDDYRRDDRAQKMAAEWLRDNRDGAGGVAAHKRRVAYYAERDWIPLLERGTLRQAAALRRDGVRYVVVDDKTRSSRNGISIESDPSLREIHRIQESNRLAFVYEISEASQPAIPAGPSSLPTR